MSNELQALAILAATLIFMRALHLGSRITVQGTRRGITFRWNRRMRP
ncbi:MAG: hypothetical protein ING65_14740 [Rhodocyclaceae bacterium]|jgi:hypothetical protein|nr:hypothetical protein [Rhodocyclaceae bacterium]